MHFPYGPNGQPEPITSQAIFYSGAIIIAIIHYPQNQM